MVLHSINTNIPSDAFVFESIEVNHRLCFQINCLYCQGLRYTWKEQIFKVSNEVKQKLYQKKGYTGMLGMLKQSPNCFVDFYLYVIKPHFIERAEYNIFLNKIKMYNKTFFSKKNTQTQSSISKKKFCWPANNFFYYQEERFKYFKFPACPLPPFHLSFGLF